MICGDGCLRDGYFRKVMKRTKGEKNEETEKKS